MKPSNIVTDRLRRAFTLIELLVTVSLIATVAGMFLVAYRSASTEAFNQRTSSTIRKISEVLNTRMQEYEEIPVALLPPIPGDANHTFFDESPTILRERVRLLALRELMCIEMPDHPDDLIHVPATIQRPTGLARNRGSAQNPSWQPVPLISVAVSNRAVRLSQRLQVPNWADSNANAELLYLIVEDSSINDSSAIELFGKSEIGDTDGDGLNEFLDAFRRPIQWIRWPSGFNGVARYVPDPWDQSLNFNLNGELEGDSIDRMRADPGFRRGGDLQLRPGTATFPLVASSGVDGRFGIRFALDSGVSGLAGYISSSLSVNDVTFPVPYVNQGPLVMPDPWFPRNDPSLRLGYPIDPVAFQDDLTNYATNGASL